MEQCYVVHISVMKAFGEVEVQLPSFLNLTVAWGEWSPLYSGHFAAGEHHPSMH